LKARERKRVYLDTSILGHWLLYYAVPEEKRDKATSNAKKSLVLLDQIQKGWFSCRFETSDFALAELLQAVRDDLVANKIKRDGHSPVYFSRLRDYYAFDKDQIEDLEAYIGQLEDLLDEINVVVYEIWIELDTVSYLITNYAIDSSDAVHLAWAERWCDYFATGDLRLLKTKPKIGKLTIVPPSGLHTLKELRKT